jgi:hypothetical protein
MNCERFFIISILSKAIENLRLHFLKIFLHTKIFFSLISFTRNRHSKVIQNYIKRIDTIKWELDLIFIEKTDSLFDFHTWLSRNANRLSQIVVAKESVDRLLQIAVAKTLCWENNYSIFKATRNWINLSMINDFVRSSIII